MWPDHNRIESATGPKAGEDKWRGVNLARAPVDVFKAEQYLNPKAYLAAKAEFDKLIL